jgi:hypothetical protein
VSKDGVAMSLRGSEATEAISQCIDNEEIATLSRKAGSLAMTKLGLLGSCSAIRLSAKNISKGSS